MKAPVVTLRNALPEDFPLFEKAFGSESNNRWLASVYRTNRYNAAFHHFALSRKEDKFFVVLHGTDPAGITCLSSIDPHDGTAALLCVLAEPGLGGRGIMTRATALTMEKAFGELGLHSVSCWVVEGNNASVRMLEKNGFRLSGRQRGCHFMDGEWKDRLLFDLLAGEFNSRKGETA